MIHRELTLPAHEPICRYDFEFSGAAMLIKKLNFSVIQGISLLDIRAIYNLQVNGKISQEIAEFVTLRMVGGDGDEHADGYWKIHDQNAWDVWHLEQDRLSYKQMAIGHLVIRSVECLKLPLAKIPSPPSYIDICRDGWRPMRSGVDYSIGPFDVEPSDLVTFSVRYGKPIILSQSVKLVCYLIGEQK